MSAFTAIKPQVNIPESEKKVLELWKEKNVFQRSMAQREGNESYVFYEGPPTANGRPGSHHIISRAYKDIFPRYQAMQGKHVLRKGGWDTHGLPVELEVQRQLGLKSKQDVVEYGLEAFNQKCRDSVFTYIQEWEEMTERMAYWVDMTDPYITYQKSYIESCWWILKQFWDQGLVQKDYKVVPYSPRTGTPYSSHEVAQGYKDVDDPSIFVKFPVEGEDNTFFLVWTTTPWTLPANVALVVGKDIDYVVLEGRQREDAPLERLILAEALVDKAVNAHTDKKGNFEVVEKLKGEALLGKRYTPLYTYLPVEKDYCYVVDADFVSTEDGTGIVHMAPAFGADDLDAAREHDLPFIMTVNDQGCFVDSVELVAGMDFKAADKPITQDLKSRGLMFHVGQCHHTYPHCWRDGGPLMYLARSTWYIRASQYKEKMVELNKTINWTPKHTGEGRFGNWLEELKDWAIGRERFWGTPLPIWVCDNPEIDHMVCVGSVDELAALCGQDLSELDLHRPYVDNITWDIEINGKKGTMRRVPEVADVWFDSGAMPYAQWGYPHKNQNQFQNQYPADYICEAVDQTRGWFYSLHAISTMLNQQVAFKNIISLGHILDKNGQKMSKSRPETFVGPWEVLDQYGADAFRWYMYTSGLPGEPRRFSVDLVADVVKSFYLTLWNVLSFFTTYAELDDFDPNAAPIAIQDRDVLDQWILGELNELIKNVTQAMDSYDAPNATKPIESFVDDLSNWYLRRSRRRFWDTEQSTDKTAAYQTLYTCLVTVSQLLAPSAPFIAETLYQALVNDAAVDGNGKDSVHLTDWPKADESAFNPTLVHEMRVVKQLVKLGHSARNDSNMRVRQPLRESLFGLPEGEDSSLVQRYQSLIIDELNVKTIDVLPANADIVSYRVKPVDTLGRELRGDFPPVRKQLTEADEAQANAWGKQLMSGEPISLAVNGKTLALTREQIEVFPAGAQGYTVSAQSGYLAALKTELDDELILEGFAREIVRRIQQLRKDVGLYISDRIEVKLDISDRLKDAVNQHQDYICEETLANSILLGSFQAEQSIDDTFDGETCKVGLVKVS